MTSSSRSSQADVYGEAGLWETDTDSTVDTQLSPSCSTGSGLDKMGNAHSTPRQSRLSALEKRRKKKENAQASRVR
jgi:hypothetical protein